MVQNIILLKCKLILDFLVNIPILEKPSWRQTTEDSKRSKPVEQTVPHWLLRHTSRRPVSLLAPSDSLTAPFWHGTGME